MTIYRQLVQAKNPRRQYQGMVSRAQGKHFEETIIDDACTYYAQKGAASIDKTPEPMRVIKSLGDGKFIAIFEKKAQPDYKGILKGGRGVMFEAKFTEAEKMEKSRVSKEQSDKLNEFAALGAECFVLAAFDRRGYYRIPWSVWCSMKDKYRRLYVKPEELDEYRVTTGRNGTLLFLD